MSRARKRGRRSSFLSSIHCFRSRSPERPERYENDVQILFKAPIAESRMKGATRVTITMVMSISLQRFGAVHRGGSGDSKNKMFSVSIRHFRNRASRKAKYSQAKCSCLILIAEFISTNLFMKQSTTCDMVSDPCLRTKHRTSCGTYKQSR